MYEKLFKRFLDFFLSLCAIIVLFPLFIVLAIVGAVVMKGNPFFTQERPGKDEKIFRLIKFRTMTCETDASGNLLPDEQRLVPYGKFLRATSLDELPELFNILKGDMSIVGPRPLLVKYLPLYSAEQHRRHSVRPGLTGYAQVHGRNAITWEEKFDFDLYYVQHISLLLDMQIILKTMIEVFRRSGINSTTSATMEEFKGSPGHCEANGSDVSADN
jgi:undecaprenyl phosphate N,N'-diacetylbacillosamine 1-phosphate transferase